MSSLPPESKPSFRERLLLRQASRATTLQEVVDDPLLQEAALLVVFPKHQFPDSVGAQSTGIIQNGETFCCLLVEVRRQVLQRLANRAAMIKVLERMTNRPQSVEQRTYEQLIRGQWDYSRWVGEEPLGAALQATLWLKDILPNLPTEGELRRRLARARFLAPFEGLAAEGFVGRRTELQEIHDFVGISELASIAEQALETFRGWLLKPKKGPLILYGPGGAGKSSLLARFILDQDAASLAHGQFPIAYLDFDNSNLKLSHPETLFLQMFQQLALQSPAVGAIETALRTRWAEFAKSPENVPDVVEGIAAQTRRFQTALQFFYTPFLDAMAEVTGGPVSAASPPFLLVLDTFEEVLERNRLASEQVFRFCEQLQQWYANVRPVIAGRALDVSLAEDLKRAHKALEIKEFDGAAAEAYLLKNGIDDTALAQAIYQQLGGTPLSLRLAALAISKGEKADARSGIRDLRTRSWLVFAAHETVVQGQLYQRILQHVGKPEIRQLAHPGLVLRRVTPELISEVLAGPCGLSLPKDANGRMKEARRLYAELRQTAFLVEPKGNALRHRTDIRRVMLDLLEKDKKDQVVAIHRGAVAFYSERGTTPEDRAEEIYHRLKLGEDPASVAGRWVAGAGQWLEDALPELNARAQRFLASHAGLKLKDEERIFRDADLSEWELFTERRVREALTRGEPLEKILALLAERGDRTPLSSLYPLEAEVLLAHRSFASAVEVLRRAIDAAAATGERKQLITCGELLGDTLSRIGDGQGAMIAFAQAERTAAEVRDYIARLRIGLQRLDLARRMDFPAKEVAAALADALRTMTAPAMEDEPLVRRALDSIIVVHPELEARYGELLRSNPWQNLESTEASLSEALRTFDWETVDELCDQLVNRIRTQTQALPRDRAIAILNRLRRKRRFEEMSRVASALIESGETHPRIRRLYGQALIDQGMLDEAQTLLEVLLKDAATPESEKTEGKGMLARVHKQRYVFSGNRAELYEAIELYSSEYRKDPDRNTWHGINAAALTARYDPAHYPEAAGIANHIVEVLHRNESERDGQAYPWDLATRMEASLVLSRFDDAVALATRYASSYDADAFEIASTLRQLVEIWQLNDATMPGSRILPVMRAALLRREGGEVKIEAEQVRTAPVARSTGTDSGILSMAWFQKGLQLSRAVARIETNGAPLGTGFLVRAEDFYPSMKGRMIMLTAAHVVETLPPGTVAHFRTFEASLPVARVLCSSPEHDLDFALLLLDGQLSVPPLEMQTEAVNIVGAQRVFVLGYPHGVGAMSLDDNVLLDGNDRVLHYRASTVPSTSGSAVLESQNWKVVAMHHAAFERVRRLDDASRTYAANEGITILAIRNAIRASQAESK